MSFTPAECKSIDRSLKTIASTLTDLRDLTAARVELGAPAPTPAADGPLPGQIPLDTCEHRLDDTCCMPFGAVKCETCPAPGAAA